MKKIVFKFVYIFVTFVLFTSCIYNKEEYPLYDDDPLNNTPAFYLRARVDNDQWNNNSFSSKLFQNSSNLHTLTVLAETNSKQSIYLTITSVNEITAQKYPLSFGQVSATYTQYISGLPVIFSSDYSDFTTSPGDITIELVDLTNKVVKGTFNFVGKSSDLLQTRVVTNGNFNVLYTTN